MTCARAHARAHTHTHTYIHTHTIAPARERTSSCSQKDIRPTPFSSSCLPIYSWSEVDPHRNAPSPPFDHGAVLLGAPCLMSAYLVRAMLECTSEVQHALHTYSLGTGFPVSRWLLGTELSVIFSSTSKQDGMNRNTTREVIYTRARTHAHAHARPHAHARTHTSSVLAVAREEDPGCSKERVRPRSTIRWRTHYHSRASTRAGHATCTRQCGGEQRGATYCILSPWPMGSNASTTNPRDTRLI